MNKIGIRAHDIGKFEDVLTLKNETSKYGFDGIQLVLKKAFSSPIDFNHIEETAEQLNPLETVMLGSYFNPINYCPKTVKKSMDYFKKNLNLASKFNSKYVGTETGYAFGLSGWNDKYAHSDKAFDKSLKVFLELAEEAKKQSAYLAIEGAYHHVCYSPRRLKQLLDELPKDSYRVILDIFNYLHIGNYQDYTNIFDEAIDLFKDKIVIFHLKDFIVKGKFLVQVPPGKGMLDYKTLIKKIQTSCPNAYLIFEGVKGENIKPSLDYIKTLLDCKEETIWN